MRGYLEMTYAYPRNPNTGYPLGMIICSYGDFEFLKSRYPKRKIVQDRYTPKGTFYWFTRHCMVTVQINDWSFWVTDEFPTIKRIRQKVSVL